MRSIFRPEHARFGLFVSLAILSAPAYSAGSSIDPDPRAPSLAEMLQREEAAQARAAKSSVPEPTPVVASPAAPVASAAPAPVQRSVRQVYPSVYAQPAVTVLVPGHR